MKASVLIIMGGCCLLWSSCRTNEPAGPSAGDLSHSGKVYAYADEMPAFPGGETALMQYLQDHIRYPAGARERGISGTVVVQFVVASNGSLARIKTIGETLGGGLEQESVAVVESMPKWLPGSNKGVNVNVQYALPIRYVLQ